MRVLSAAAAGIGPLPGQLEEALTQRAVFIGGASVSVRGNGPGFTSGYGGGGSATFRIKVLGYSFDGVERLAMDLKERLERIPRVRDVDINSVVFWGQDKAYAVSIIPNRAALERYGVTAPIRERRRPRGSRTVGRQRLEVGGEEIQVTVKAEGARERRLEQLRWRWCPPPVAHPSPSASWPRSRSAKARRRLPRGSTVRAHRRVRVPGPQQARPADARGLHGVDCLPARLFGGRRGSATSRREREGALARFAIGVALVVLTVALVFDSVWAPRWCRSASRLRWRRGGGVLGGGRGVQPGGRRRRDPRRGWR